VWPKEELRKGQPVLRQLLVLKTQKGRPSHGNLPLRGGSFRFPDRFLVKYKHADYAMAFKTAQ